MSNLNLKGIWIPIEILTDNKLRDKEKIIYTIIIYLSKEKRYCYLTNLDETTPHMHLIYIPVIHTKDRDSYRDLQNEFHKYITSKGFGLERGLPVEETGAKHYKIEDLKKITNFEDTKKVLENVKLELPEIPNINDIKLIKLNKEKVENEIIKPKDELIQELYRDNITLHRELSKQAKVVNEAEKYQKERDKIIANNKELNSKVKKIENEYKEKSNTLDLKFDSRKRELEKEFEEKNYEMKYEYKSKIRNLEKENNKLHKIIDKFYETIEKFITWICKKFDIGAEDYLIRDFQKETNTFIDPVKQIKHEEREKEWDLER